MPPRKVIYALAAGVPLLILGTVLGVAAWTTVAAYRAVLGGPTTEAVVVGVSRCPGTQAWQCSRRSDVAVELRFSTPDGIRTEHAASGVIPPIGDRVLVRYDPNRPERVIILREWESERRELRWMARISVGLVVALALLIAVAFVKSRRRKRSSAY